MRAIDGMETLWGPSRPVAGGRAKHPTTLKPVQRKGRAVSQSGRKINAKEVQRDLQAGMSSSDLMEKYKLSSKGLESLLTKMRNAGLLTETPQEGGGRPKATIPSEARPASPKSPGESVSKQSQPAPRPAIAWTCPACGRNYDTEHSECPGCGIVVSKLTAQAAPEMPPHAGVHERSYQTAADYGTDDDDFSESGTNVELMLGVAGAIVLFLGAFTPIVKVPVVGGLNYFQLGKFSEGVSIGGYLIIALAVGSLALALTRKGIGHWVTGLGALAVLGFTYMRYKQGVRQAMDQMNQLKDKFQAGPPPGLEGKVDLGKFADQMANQLQNLIQMDWGWVVLFIGAALLLAAAFVATKNAARS